MILSFTATLLNAQNAIVVAGGQSDEVSYTIGSDLIQMQIIEEKEISLGIPKYETTEPSKGNELIKNKKRIIEKIIEAIIKIFKKQKR